MADRRTLDEWRKFRRESRRRLRPSATALAVLAAAVLALRVTVDLPWVAAAVALVPPAL